MLITDFSDQELITNNQKPSSLVPELLTAGIIFILPIIFLLVLSAS
ncbi:MAG: hypothetical protein UW64_C0009G0035 [Microgenomates group bacterium GW2011_GWC1_44_37]|uniref:Uncharacterized protein n=1 Tax=Candidatus Collierbacteria bacterium GW2011_GWB2_44_22 TaxID=1618387 RepID=A0A0G1HY72_9BACT|nr:MAG: hypothetical protein UW31_C0002G0037 [Candidatus Collierbacteria bacterium GW2011_GWA2_44_13]KKT51895.1 MAG: hypothetical protein UW44_C0006G0013 [Candidatus Collierbacteria bacterium GW2011_GWB2_44_22]KKT62205.1 MAG: hypothetical protein UW56_C0010G0037 [Candidatus Collierbacteria bacterium GW2011_GWD1_44_27]KKT66182.1 MAG: hypothetical protein UW58_C0012G0024 [Candidatus Collierbacteria bacterium GW2011_GWC2_44_30]KKT68823.1 MAG: hypothetical protein UW64_C0009G0035 [Microgenomates gr